VLVNGLEKPEWPRPDRGSHKGRKSVKQVEMTGGIGQKRGSYGARRHRRFQKVGESGAKRWKKKTRSIKVSISEKRGKTSTKRNRCLLYLISGRTKPSARMASTTLRRKRESKRKAKNPNTRGEEPKGRPSNRPPTKKTEHHKKTAGRQKLGHKGMRD